jgi:hypothetical protein
MDAAGRKRKVPAVLTAMGMVPAAGAALFAGRIVYESTFVTCQRGLQMVGFALLHSTSGILGLLALLLGLLWVIAIVVVAAYRRTWMSPSQMLLIGIVALSFGLLAVPYGHWKLLTVKICGIERVKRDWLIEAAAKGETPLLKHLIANGFDIDTRNWAGETLLTIAKRTGHTSTSEWLIAHGARE